MTKQVIVNEDKKTCVVLITEDTCCFGKVIRGKGVAKCHEHDTFDKEKGIAIATNRALRQYYSWLIKSENAAIKRIDEFLTYYDNMKVKRQESLMRAVSKFEELKQEYEEIEK